LREATFLDGRPTLPLREATFLEGRPTLPLREATTFLEALDLREATIFLEALDLREACLALYDLRSSAREISQPLCAFKCLIHAFALAIKYTQEKILFI